MGGVARRHIGDGADGGSSAGRRSGSTHGPPINLVCEAVDQEVTLEAAEEQKVEGYGARSEFLEGNDQSCTS